MAEAFLITFENMLMIIVMIMIGYGLRKAGIITAHMDTVISKLTVYVFLPSLNLYTFTTQCTVANFKKYANMILFGILFYLIAIVISTVVSNRIKDATPYMRSIYRYCLSIPNTGGVGTPLVLALFGVEGLFVYYMFLLPATVITYGWAVPQLMPGGENGKFQVKNIINPPMIACMIGIVFGLLGVGEAAPEVVLTTVQKLSGCYTPTALLVVGYVIAHYRIKDIIHVKIDLLIMIVGQVIIPGLFLACLKIANAPFMLTAMVVLTFACPVGMNCVIYPSAYGEDSTTGAGLILVTYLAAIITVPLLYAFIF